MVRGFTSAATSRSGRSECPVSGLTQAPTVVRGPVNYDQGVRSTRMAPGARGPFPLFMPSCDPRALAYGSRIYRESPAVGARGRATGSPLQKIFIFGGGHSTNHVGLASDTCFDNDLAAVSPSGRAGFPGKAGAEALRLRPLSKNQERLIKKQSSSRYRPG